MGNKDDTFILASQVKQVFYITDSANKKWSIVLSTNPKNTSDGDDENNTEDNIDKVLLFSIGLTNGNNIDITEGDIEKDINMREDHFEGILAVSYTHLTLPTIYSV